MRMGSANRHAVVVACTVFLFGGLWSAGGAHEVSLRDEQNAQLQDQTRLSHLGPAVTRNCRHFIVRSNKEFIVFWRTGKY